MQQQEAGLEEPKKNKNKKTEQTESKDCGTSRMAPGSVTTRQVLVQ
jgi:hypothetical protein